MSVIVTGVDKPKNCMNCFVCSMCEDGESIFCDANHKQITDFDNMPKNCPLKSVEGLIDTIKTMNNDYKYNGHDLSIEGVIEIIKNYSASGSHKEN